MNMKTQTLAWALAALAGTASPLLAVEKGKGANPVAANLNYVGKHQSEETPFDFANCTASHIANGVVLTAGHCIDSGASSRYRSFNRFTLGQARAALPVVHPQYMGEVGEGNKDIALLLVLNGQDDNSSGRNILATNAEDVTLIANIGGAAPAVAQIVGWQFADDSTFTQPLRGVTSVIASPAGEWRYDRTAAAAGAFTGSNWVNRGDSGGPSFYDFGGATGTKLIGVHSFRDARKPADATRDVDTRVSPNLDFIDGKGVNNQAVFTRLKGTGNRSLAEAADWTRAVNPAATLPSTDDIAILDPNSSSNAGDTTVTLDNASTASLGGLLTDVTLRVRNAATLKVTGKSGVLNGGELDASGALAKVEVGHQFYNTGTIKGRDRAMFTIGNAAPASVNNKVFANDDDLTGTATEFVSTLMFNDRTARIDLASGSTLTTKAQLKNFGRLDMTGENTAVTIGADLPAKVGTIAVPANPVALLNTSAPANSGGAGTPRVNVGPGATLTARNAAKTAVTQNGRDASISVIGGNSLNARFNASIVDNAGVVEVASMGRVEVQGATTNQGTGRLTVSNGGVFTGGPVTNKTGDILGGSVTVGGPFSFLVATGSGTTAAFENQRGASLSIDPGAEVISNGRISNAGNVTMRSSHDEGRSVLRVTRDSDFVRGKLVNTGRMNFGLNLDPMLLPVEKPEIVLDDADFANDHVQARLRGDLKWKITGHSNWINRVNDQADVALSRYNAFDMVWDAATTDAGAAVTMETLSEKPNLMPGALPPLTVLDSSLALRSMCLTNSSIVKLVGDFDNDGAKATEVIYVRFLGITANSMLRTNGFTLYYLDADPLCGLDLSRIDRTGGGDVVRIPTPTGAAVLALAGVFAARRRRAMA